MRSRIGLALALLLAPAALCAADAGPDIRDTRMLTDPAISAERIAFIYAGDLWTCDLDGKSVRRLTSSPGAEASPAFSPDGRVDRLLGAAGRQHRRLRRRRRRRRAEAADLAPRSRRRRRLHARREVGRLHVAAGRLHQPLHAALHRPGRGRRRGEAPDPEREPRRLLAGREAHRLQPGRAAVSPVEAVPRRGRLADLALRRREPRDRQGPAASRRAPTTPGRCGSATRSTSAPTATASSTSIPSTRRRRRSGA